MSTPPSGGQPGTPSSVPDHATVTHQPLPRDNQSVIEAGLEIHGDGDDITLTQTPLFPPGPSRSLTLTEAFTQARQTSPTPSEPIRWVAHDLTTTARYLREREYRMWSGMCLDSAEDILDLRDGVLPPPAREQVRLQERYAMVIWRVAVALDRTEAVTLVNLESDRALLAAEFNAVGLPWNSTTFKSEMAMIAGTPTATEPYPLLEELDQELSAALGAVDFDWRGAFSEAFDGVTLTMEDGPEKQALDALDSSTKEKLLQYVNISALTSEFGYDWADRWVVDGRWRPVFRPATAVPELWSVLGGALRFPAQLRCCVQAPPDRILLRVHLPRRTVEFWEDMTDEVNLLSRLDRLHPVHREAVQHIRDRVEGRLAIFSVLHHGFKTLTWQEWDRLCARSPKAMDYLGSVTSLDQNRLSLRTVLGRPFPPPDVLAQEGVRRPHHLRTDEMRSAISERGKQALTFMHFSNIAEFTCLVAAKLRRELAQHEAQLLLVQHDEILIETDPARADAVEQAVLHARRDAYGSMVHSDNVSGPPSLGRGQTWAEATANSTLR